MLQYPHQHLTHQPTHTPKLHVESIAELWTVVSVPLVIFKNYFHLHLLQTVIFSLWNIDHRIKTLAHRARDRNDRL